MVFAGGRVLGSVDLRRLGAPSSAQVKFLQKNLRAVGFSDIKVTGVLDAKTVAAINGIFGGWDDAPPKYKTGALTAAEIGKNLNTVVKLMKSAVGGQLKIDAKHRYPAAPPAPPPRYYT
jgi:hypothetical protein